MAYIKKEPIVEFITKGLNNPDKTKAFGYDAIEILTEIEFSPTADVVPRSEVERLNHILDSYALQYGTVTDKQKVIDKAKSEVLSDLKKEIHDRAVYPHNAGISPYVSLKVVDALINNLISR